MADTTPPDERDEQKQTVTSAAKNGGHGKFWTSMISVWLGLGIVGAILFIVGLWAFVGPSDPTEKKDFIQAVGILLAGLVGLVGLYFTWKNLDQTRQATQRTLELTEQGQITDRFTRAIDQLGETDDKGRKKLEIRLGGIYALERIARDSRERDYSTVMEVLMAYIWENAPWPPKSSEPPERGFIRPPEGGSVSVSMSNEASKQDKDAEQDTQFPTPPTDIQAILEVLKRREEERVPGKHRVLVDLQRTDLRGANLAEAKLKGAILRGAHLEGADLRDAHLEEALLRDAHLEGALLDGASLQEAHLVRVRLEGASLWVTNLQRANLADAHLEGAGCFGTNLKEALLNEAYLEGAQLVRVHLEGANLSGTHLEGAMGLTPEQIEWTIGDDKTELPEYLADHRPPAWSKSLEEQTNIIEERLKQEPKGE